MTQSNFDQLDNLASDFWQWRAYVGRWEYLGLNDEVAMLDT